MWGRPLDLRWSRERISQGPATAQDPANRLIRFSYLCSLHKSHTVTTTTQIFDYKKWTSQLADLSKKYQGASPYPHIVLENFLNPAVLDECITEFDKLNENNGWINYKHYNEDKRGLNKIDLLPETIRETIQELNSPAFLEWLSTLTGIKNLQKDESLEGGGIHQSTRGGFLNIHADFTAHPHQKNWQRRGNVFVYLYKKKKKENSGESGGRGEKIKVKGSSRSLLLKIYLAFGTSLFKNTKPFFRYNSFSPGNLYFCSRSTLVTK